MPSHGLSGNVTIFVRPSKGRRNYNLKLVKLGSRFEMQSEKDNYDRVINEYLDTYVGMITKNIVTSEEHAGIVYTSVGSAVNYLPGKEVYPCTLYEFINEKLCQHDGGMEVEKALEIIYTKILKSLYRDKKVEDFEICNKYGAVLPPILTIEEINLDNDNNTIQINLKDPPQKIIETCLEIENGGRVTIGGFVYEIKNDKKKNIKMTRLYNPCNNFKFDFEKEVLFHQDTAEDESREKEEEIILTGKCRRNFIDILKGGLYEADNLFANKSVSDILKEIEVSPLFENFLSLFNKTTKLSCSTIHGDLNLTNILMTGIKSEIGTMAPDTIDYWLVDFAKTEEEGHTAFDLVKLEVEIKTQILSNILFDIANAMYWGIGERNYDYIVKSYHIFEGFLAFNQISPNEAEKENIYNFLLNIINEEQIVKILQEPRLKQIFFIISKIRSLALREGISEEEYLCSVIFYSLSALKFKNLRNKSQVKSAPLPVLVAYISAAVNYEKLDKL